MSEETKEIALVTGANKGIGYQVALELGGAGMIVYLGSRNLENGTAAASQLQDKGFDVRPIVLDVDDKESIRAASDRLTSEFGRLDVLINNAGIVAPGDASAGTVDIDALRRTFETNFFGAVSLTQSLLPLIRKSSNGRIVNVSSGLGSLTLNADPSSGFSGWRLLGYNASKAALNMFTIQLAAELKDAGIMVNAVNPGYTATDINGNRGHQTLEEGAAEIVRMALQTTGGPTGGFTEAEGTLPW